jgi:hypothetical protein
MTLTLHPKPSLDAFIQTCTPLAVIESLEAEFDQRVTRMTQAVLNYVASDDPIINLKRFLQVDPDFIGVILALTNLSQEKFLRILSAERFAEGDYAPEWGIDQVRRRIARDDAFAEHIATLFIDGRNSPLLRQQIAAFYLQQLGLPSNWADLVRDPQIITNAVRQKLKGEYNDRKGDAIEAIVQGYLNALSLRYGITYAKGQVPLVGKEVDHVLPSKESPFVMIMNSYMETTSSSQTARANEQSEMYRTMIGANIRYNRQCVFVNFVDGAGWLARRTDLRKLHAACDYILNLKTLDHLEAITCKYMPAACFTAAPRPQVEG